MTPCADDSRRLGDQAFADAIAAAAVGSGLSLVAVEAGA
jgi:hypothetical protein